MSPVKQTMQGPDCALVKFWETPPNGVRWPSALPQLLNLSSAPFLHGHIAVMPGFSTVFVSVGAIIPAALGTDIGCGTYAVKTDIRAEHLPDNTDQLRVAIANRIPSWSREHEGPAVRRSGFPAFAPISATYPFTNLREHSPVDVIPAGSPDGIPIPKALKRRVDDVRMVQQIGTLRGSWKHFVAVSVDSEGFVWVLLQSGSHTIGCVVSQYYTDRAKERCYNEDIDLPDEDLAYLVEHTQDFDDFVTAVTALVGYARLNRTVLMTLVLDELRALFPLMQQVAGIHAHHNYLEVADGRIVTRRGAISVPKDKFAIVADVTRGYIVRGKGEPESYHSCASGSKSSMAIEEVMANQTDLVDVVTELRPVFWFH